MSDVVIRAEGLGKKYLIGHQTQAERYTALRDVIARTAKGIGRSARDMLQGRQLVSGDEIEEFWALKDINFEIKRGDVVGIIGRNGAGKSTLLKILSRITEPSTGKVEIKGRVASLLEVGTGFHPELSGRENIYLNGAILGMSRSEIKRKFDEIVAFAEVDKFLDTPVKHYSSGMYVRLAFAVAAHLEPEILVVDEVLAVGDAEFQKKCLGKMGEVAAYGRTVLFVSHNMAAIRMLCRDSILLNGGNLTFHGATQETLAKYGSNQQFKNSSKKTRPYISGVEIKQSSINFMETTNEYIKIDIIAHIDRDDNFEIRAFIRSAGWDPVGIASVGGFGSQGVFMRQGTHKLTFGVDFSLVAAGLYYFDIEMVRVSDRKEFQAPERIEYLHNKTPQAGEAGVLTSDFGIGCIRFPAMIDGIA